MCSWGAAIMVGVTLLSGAVSYSASKTSQAYSEQVADQNKQVAEAQAIDAERLGQIEANERRLRTRLQMASQSVGFGAQNVEQTGTALDILGDTAMFGEIDVQRIQANAQRKAWGFRMQGHEIESQKRLMQYQGKVDRTGTILSTIGGVAGAWGGAGTGAAKLGSGGTNTFASSAGSPYKATTVFKPYGG